MVLLARDIAKKIEGELTYLRSDKGARPARDRHVDYAKVNSK